MPFIRSKKKEKKNLSAFYSFKKKKKKKLKCLLFVQKKLKCLLFVQKKKKKTLVPFIRSKKKKKKKELKCMCSKAELSLPSILTSRLAFVTDLVAWPTLTNEHRLSKALLYLLFLCNFSAKVKIIGLFLCTHISVYIYIYIYTWFESMYLSLIFGF